MRSISRRSAGGHSVICWTALLLALSAASTPNANAQGGSAATGPNAPVVTLTGLTISDIKVGAGPSPKVGQTCTINYTSWLYVNGAKGDKVESSLDRGQPLTFVLGKGQVRREWDEGVATMKVGGKRTIVAPAEIGVSPAIEKDREPKGAEARLFQKPPGMIFEIELLDVR